MVEERDIAFFVIASAISICMSNLGKMDLSVIALVGLICIPVAFQMHLSRSHSNVSEQEQNMLLLLKSQISCLDAAFESVDIYLSSSDSYTENKSRIFLNFHKRDGSIYNVDTMMNVLLHELAHLISTQHDPEHVTKEFHENFKRLKLFAEQKRIFNPGNLEHYESKVV